MLAESSVHAYHPYNVHTRNFKLPLQASNPTAKPPAGAAPKKNSKFLPFVHAHTYALSLKLKSKQAWEVWRKTGARPPNIPSNPDRVYQNGGWQGWGHWLGSSNQKTKVFLPFDQAHAYALSLELKGVSGWNAWRKSGGRPANVPSTPEQVYKTDGWQGWGHWLGTGNVYTNRRANSTAVGRNPTHGRVPPSTWH